MIEFQKSFPHADSSRFKHIARYDAKVDLFFVGAQDNGEGWWNWWVALAEQGPAAGDHAIYEAGGNATWDEARTSIEGVLRFIADNLLKVLTTRNPVSTRDGDIRNMLRAQGLCGQMFDGKACVELKDHDAGIHERGWRVTRRVDEDPYAKDSRETITRYVVSDGVRLFKADDEKSANWLAEILNTIETK